MRSGGSMCIMCHVDVVYSGNPFRWSERAHSTAFHNLYQGISIEIPCIYIVCKLSANNCIQLSAINFIIFLLLYIPLILSLPEVDAIHSLIQ